MSVSVSRSIENDTALRGAHRWLHPLHAFLLAGAAYFLVSGCLSDWLYFSTQEIQWKNFAMWLIMGGLVCAGAAILWAIVDVTRATSMACVTRWRSASSRKRAASNLSISTTVPP